MIPAHDVQAECVSLLAYLHGDVCDSWRVCVVTNALRSQDEALRAAAVKVCPVLLHHMGPSHHSLISTTLLCVKLSSVNVTFS